MGMQIYKPVESGNPPFLFKRYDTNTQFKSVIDDGGTWSFLDYFALGQYGNKEAISGILNIANYGDDSTPENLLVQLVTQENGQYIPVSGTLSAPTIASLNYMFRASYVIGPYTFSNIDYSGNIVGAPTSSVIEPFPLDQFDMPNGFAARYSYCDVLNPAVSLAVRYNSSIPSSEPAIFGNKTNNFLFLS